MQSRAERLTFLYQCGATFLFAPFLSARADCINTHIRTSLEKVFLKKWPTFSKALSVAKHNEVVLAGETSRDPHEEKIRSHLSLDHFMSKAIEADSIKGGRKEGRRTDEDILDIKQ